MAEHHYDVVVIGAGPSGEGAAMNATKHGKRVAIIEDKPTVGGNCTHWGTIPSKALRHSVKQIITFNTNQMFRDIGEPRWFSFPRVLQNAQKVIGKQVKLRTQFYARNRVDLINGRASFIDSNRLEIRGNKSHEVLHFKQAIIATGSRPYLPPDVDFRHHRIYNSDTILNLSHTPRTLIIYGAGVIGSEYASIFAGLGVKVDLINPGSRLLTFLDDEISDALSYHLRNNGVLVRHNEEYESVDGDDHGVVLSLKSGKKIRADAFLWCNGRSGNTEKLGLDNIGLTPNGRGQLAVDDHYRTEVENVYAAGDVIGWPSLASAAYDQGRSASSDIVKDDYFRLVSDVPTGIYTLPEISSVGKTERELTEAKVPYEVGQAFFKDLARAQITGDPVGMLKILFHRESRQLLGIHCFGDQAAEIVHIGQAIMNQEGEANSLNYFINTTFNYPTMAEAYRVAALNGLNRIF
ncbi:MULTISPECIES: Si-specific NAD(P)(+) transhydrogenase [Marinobacter]|jgi:NAD(P) transhydrogenase|uniref:Soluble pyridine nucleotide transhydrogenase n=3 Tax=Marinobacter salarius TaxID=1420917 RepID=A0A1W6K8D8_9GAMM|nr:MULTISPECIES: Si-specific NAD(P)(+) transhydrogenase [Marinobacter]ARM83684.1 soluble pyridine nucleotide transhydrogenase [Marinobacter salarius]AZR42523.1 NAD(P)(+) transhydrogenase (Si-specific) [Marinobacter salarius]KXJ46162.1 MAG: pyridine nucleotide-disulfide oxidoreductase [Marinobacter sp. Hex_13]MAB50461.1 Si-specific NAD(P)(+) transhydrogenase [Marinobacter sp.]MBJ7299184.1 Si-specific NAD(P)(+) transhydrogenase [Marinobacter salarius]|tara:strand:- start:10053 stop:11444 length:1392 start_codon:yes stop_codon:yes gene_type:complete